MFGSQITKAQLEYLSEFKRIIIIPDDDAAGYTMCKKISSVIKNSYVIPVTADDTSEDYVKQINTLSIVSASNYWIEKTNFLQKRLRSKENV